MQCARIPAIKDNAVKLSFFGGVSHVQILPLNLDQTTTSGAASGRGDHGGFSTDFSKPQVSPYENDFGGSTAPDRKSATKAKKKSASKKSRSSSSSGSASRNSQHQHPQQNNPDDVDFSFAASSVSSCCTAFFPAIHQPTYLHTRPCVGFYQLQTP